MTTEEKAKAYDEALDRMKHVVIVPKNEKALQALKETIFPELAESEDERTRKEIIEFIRSQIEDGNSVGWDRWIAWLEKQKELPFVKDVMLGYPGLYFYDGERMHFRGNPAMEEKRKEHKEETLRDFIDNFPYSAEQKEQEHICDSIQFEEGFKTGLELGLRKQKEQKPAEPGSMCVESDYYKGYRDGKEYQLRQVEQYSIGKTFMGLIPCWINAPSTLQPAHRFHGRNAVIMHESHGGFRCVLIDDEKPKAFHLPENTLFVEGWRKKSTEWSEEDERRIEGIVQWLREYQEKFNPKYDSLSIESIESLITWLKSLRPQTKEELAKMLQDEYNKGKETGEREGYTKGYNKGYKDANESVSYHFPIMPTTPSGFGCDGTHCTNPQMDCINCPKKLTGGMFNTASSSGDPTLKAEWKSNEGLDTDTLRDWSMRFAPDIREAIEATAYHFYNIRPHWKPSEEQIYSLGTVVKGYNECTVGSVEYNLKELYDNLKKLK